MRHLYYSESASVKELAFQLGFNDPEYFARLFKREAGKSVSGFIQDLSGL
jgi:AraC-like DNA-binding protein